MTFLPRTDEQTFAQAQHVEAQEHIKWEVDQTPEALYSRINDISTFFSKGKYTKALAVQRLLDLLYDIDKSTSEVYCNSAKSRYYLLIFNYIYRIRSTRIFLKDIVRRQPVSTDQKMYISGIDFSSLTLPGLHIGNALFKECNFSLSSLQDLAVSNCQFVQCRFKSANLTHAELIGSSFEGVTLTGSNLSSSRIMKSSFVGCDFSEIISSRGQYPLRINGCSMVACSFREADLKGADFRNTRMTGCDTLDAKNKDAKGLM